MSKTPSENRCQQTTSLGRRCRSPRSEAHPSLCSYHAREESQKSNNPLALALELLGPVQNFRTAASINHVLGKLLLLLATDRIPPRNAAVLAYICQLLLQSLEDVKRELWQAEDSPELQKALKQILDSPRMTLSPSERTKGRTAASKFVDQVCKFTLSKGRTEGPALVKSNAVVAASE